ncbi:hypothetical protein GCM10010276_86490 [Streptomyces longisporus]|uniref:Uncharacterized protein n=1 Tax=Streptomyces longisporus TaxID=1948 RepID=A0ABN3NHI5_STRLO
MRIARVTVIVEASGAPAPGREATPAPGPGAVRVKPWSEAVLLQCRPSNVTEVACSVVAWQTTHETRDQTCWNHRSGRSTSLTAVRDRGFDVPSVALALKVTQNHSS